MDRERLARLLEEPGKVAREDIADLKALTEQYPWFSGAHLLRAVGEQAGGDVLANETLRNSAAHVPSRAVLFDLRDMSVEQAAAQLKERTLARRTEEEPGQATAKRKGQAPTEAATPVKVVPTPIPASGVSNDSDDSDDPSSVAATPIKEEPFTAPVKNESEVDQASPAAAAVTGELLPSPAKDPESAPPVAATRLKGDAKEPERSATTEALLPAEIDPAVIETGIEEAEVVESEEDTADLGISDEEDISTELLITQDVQEATKTDLVPIEDRSTDPIAPEIEVDQTVVEEVSEDPVKEDLDRQILEAAIASVYDLTWQEQVKEQGRSEPPTPKIVSKEVAASPEPEKDHQEKLASKDNEAVVASSQKRITPRSKLKFTDWLSVPTDDAPVAEGPTAISDQAAEAPGNGPVNEAVLPTPKITPPVDSRTLIDRFIEHENPPPVRKAEFFTPQQAAKKSLDDSAGLVSETLAKIYEKQGNFQKASEAYRKLALKYPEKSAYFAALSKSLEGRSNA